MEAVLDANGIIEATYCDGRGIQRLKMLELATFANYNFDWYSKLKPPSKSNSVILPEGLRKMLINRLKEGGFGYYVRCFPHDINGILLPTVETHIWQLLIFDGSIALAGQQVPLELTQSVISKETTDFFGLLTKESLFSNSKFIINKSYNEITTSISSFDTGTKLDMNIIEHRPSENLVPDIAMDPLTFLTERYYSMLYNQHSMLSYFAKSSVPKLQLLCGNDPKFIFELLDKCLFVDSSGLHVRYANTTNLDLGLNEFKEEWLNTAVTINKEKEAFYKLCVCDRLLKSIPNGVKLVTSEFFMKYWKGLKVKETKMQIILALEMLKLIHNNPEVLDIRSNTSETSESNLHKKPVKRKRPILVGKKKRLMPTLLGTVIATNMNSDFDLNMKDSQNVNKQSLSKNSSRTAESVKELINRLFDELTVIDALNSISHKEPSSAYSFIVTCLIPFYEKDHLSFLKELVCRARGASYLVKRKTRKDKERKKREKEKFKKISIIDSDETNYNGHLEGDNKVRKEGSVIEISDLKLRRTHSSFGSKVDWERKGFDMIKHSSTFLSSTKQSDSEGLGFSNNNQTDLTFAQHRSQTLGGFMTSIKRRRELKTNSAQKEQSVKEPQTPKKIKERLSLLNDMFANEQQIKHGDIIEATPRKRDGILDSKNNNQQRGSNSTSKQFANAEESPFQIETTTSPSRKGNKKRKLGVGNGIITETPIKQVLINNINSSPLKVAGEILNVVEETPTMDRIEVKPGVFEINSSPFKSPEAKTAKEGHKALQNSSLKLTELSTLMQRNDTNIIPETSSPAKSQKTINRRLNFN